MASSSEDPASLAVQFGHLAIKEDRQTPGVEGVTPGQGTVFKVMSMNVGKNRRYEGNEKKNAEQRRKEVVALLKDEKPDLVFLQECSSPTKLADILEEPWKVWEGVIDSGKSYTCIIHNDNDNDKIQVKKHDFHTIHNEKKISNEGQFLTRLFVRQCTSKDGESLGLLVASYHGRHEGLKDEKKITIFEDLLKLLDEVCKEAKCKVLIGGDFNLKYAKAKKVVQERSSTSTTCTQVASSSSSRKSNHIEYKYNLYTQGFQDKPMDDMVDYFMYNGPKDDVRVDVRVGMFKDANDLFDHKPLYADVKLSN